MPAPRRPITSIRTRHYGEGVYNPNNPLSSIAIEDVDEGVVGYTPDGQPVYEAKKKETGLQDLAEQEVKKEAIKYGKDSVKEAFGIGGGAALANATGAVDDLEGLSAALSLQEAGIDPAIASGLAVPAAESGWALSGIGSAGNYIAPAAGALGLADLYMNRPQNIGHGSGYLQGAASGAAIGSYFGPWGAGIGAGLGLLGNALGIGGESRTKGEEKARDKLEEAGVMVPNSDVKEWELNPTFKESRKESDLTGKDIIHSADFYNIRGFSDLDPTKQESITQEALNQGLIREQLGKINLTMTPEYQKYLEGQLGVADTGGGGDSRQIEAENKKRRKQQALSSLMPEIMANPTKAPRYDQNPGSLISNPYL